MNLKHHLTTDFKNSLPLNYDELYQRLDNLLGMSVSSLAQILNIKLDSNNTKIKGYLGQMLEIYLGADGNNKADVDFSNLDLELKTVSTDENLNPLESPFICSFKLFALEHMDFYQSVLYRKIKKILFVLISGKKHEYIGNKIIKAYFIFTPNHKQLAIIKQDYDELMHYICTGQCNAINATIGTIIQMRPKAANGSALTQYLDANGKLAYTRPRGFYMRRAFIVHLCQKIKNCA